MNARHTKRIMLVSITLLTGVVALIIFLSSGVHTLSSAETAGTGVNEQNVHPADRKFYNGTVNDDIRLGGKSPSVNVAAVDRKLFDAGYVDIVMKGGKTSAQLDLESVHPADRKFFSAAYGLETAGSAESLIERVDGKLFDAGYLGIVWAQSRRVAPDLTGIHPADRKFFTGSNY